LFWEEKSRFCSHGEKGKTAQARVFFQHEPKNLSEGKKFSLEGKKVL
jgi:hypothetical protein